MRISLLLCLGVSLVSSRAYALGDCEVDADCGDGYTCEVVGGSGCATVACASGETCPEPEPCEPEEYYGCVPAPCVSDSDCGDDLACFSVTYEQCTGVARPDCAPDSECPDAEPVDPECTTVEESFCAPVYAAPCETDTDCGAEGFTCAEVQSCRCSGSGSGGSGGEVPPGEPSADGGVEDDGAAPDAGAGDDGTADCSCETTGEKYCELDELACDADSDCPDGWSCDADVETAPCSYNMETGAETCAEPTAENKLCFPPHWNEGWGYATGGSGSDALAAAAGEDAEDPRFSSQNVASGSPGGGGGGSSCALGRVRPARGGAWIVLLFAAAAVFIRARFRARAGSTVE